MSAMEYTITPVCSGVSSVIRPKCAFTTLLPYKNGISPLGLIQILCCHQVHYQQQWPRSCFHPHSYLCVLCQMIQCSNVQGELAGLGELAKAYTQRSKVITTNITSHPHHRFTIPMLILHAPLSMYKHPT